MNSSKINITDLMHRVTVANKGSVAVAFEPESRAFCHCQDEGQGGCGSKLRAGRGRGVLREDWAAADRDRKGRKGAAGTEASLLGAHCFSDGLSHRFIPCTSWSETWFIRPH